MNKQPMGLMEAIRQKGNTTSYTSINKDVILDAIEEFHRTSPVISKTTIGTIRTIVTDKTLQDIFIDYLKNSMDDLYKIMSKEDLYVQFKFRNKKFGKSK